MSLIRPQSGAALRLLLVTMALASACDDGAPARSAVDAREALSGGDTSVDDSSRDAFARPAENILDAHRSAFFTGNTFFNRNWVMAPASTDGTDGLGPTFNARSCSSCHFKDGRGAPPVADEPFVGLLLRLSVPGMDAHGAPLSEPSYGGQFNHLAVRGVQPEGDAFVRYEEQAGTFADGTRYTLAAPHYTLENLSFGPLAEGAMISPRVAPAVFGLGLLAAIPEQTLAMLDDPDDADGDGISGRFNHVWDPIAQDTSIGRFGWKANQAGLEQQNVAALVGDIGITSSLFPAQDCPLPQLACQAAPNGGEPEIDQQKIDFITHYTHLLAVPMRRDVADAQVQRGQRLFTQLGCAACHVPSHQTGPFPSLPELENQTIHAYTDLLLHDMGEALADARPDFEASGSEWRTPPLWGIGLTQTVNRHTRFLHDGRARDLSEAVLWHGGEAEPAREAYRTLPEAQRAALLSFLQSL